MSLILDQTMGLVQEPAPEFIALGGETYDVMPGALLSPPDARDIRLEDLLEKHYKNTVAEVKKMVESRETPACRPRQRHSGNDIQTRDLANLGYMSHALAIDEAYEIQKQMDKLPHYASGDAKRAELKKILTAAGYDHRITKVGRNKYSTIRGDKTRVYNTGACAGCTIV